MPPGAGAATARAACVQAVLLSAGFLRVLVTHCLLCEKRWVDLFQVRDRGFLNLCGHHHLVPSSAHWHAVRGPCDSSTELFRQGIFYRQPSAAGGHDWLPAPLGWKLASARNTVTAENNRNWAKLLLHDVYFIRSKIHRSTITTVARPQLAGSVEPATKAKQHYITGYIQ